MANTLSEHQVRVYEYAKAQSGRWFTIQELSTDANIPDGSAKGHAVRFEEMGIFERMKVSPAHLFRLSEFAGTRDPKTIRRLDAAIPVFAERRREWLRREMLALSHSSSGQVAGELSANAPLTSSPVQLIPQRAPLAEVPELPTIQPGPQSTNDLSTHSSPSMPSAFEVEVSDVEWTCSAAGNAEKTPTLRATRVDKTKLLFEMIRRPEGATLDELAAALGNLPHSVRASISVKSRELGIKVECEGGRYFIAEVA